MGSGKALEIGELRVWDCRMHARFFLLSGPLRQALWALPGGPDRGHAFGSQGLAAGVGSGVCSGDRVRSLEIDSDELVGPNELAAADRRTGTSWWSMPHQPG